MHQSVHSVVLATAGGHTESAVAVGQTAAGADHLHRAPFEQEDEPSFVEEVVAAVVASKGPSFAVDMAEAVELEDALEGASTFFAELVFHLGTSSALIAVAIADQVLEVESSFVVEYPVDFVAVVYWVQSSEIAFAFAVELTAAAVRVTDWPLEFGSHFAFGVKLADEIEVAHWVKSKRMAIPLDVSLAFGDYIDPAMVSVKK